MTEKDFENYLLEALNTIGIAVEKNQFDQFVAHYNLLMKYNRVVNLTSLDDPSQIAFKLFADSLLSLGYIRRFKRVNILDIGPGGGFPSIPLRILTPPEISFTLVERRKKVVFFLEELISSLSLSNINVVSGRIEHFTNSDNFRGQFDLVLNKAVFKGDIFFPVVRPFLADHGKALWWASGNVRNENPPEGWKIIEIIGPPEYDHRFPGVVMIYKSL